MQKTANIETSLTVITSGVMKQPPVGTIDIDVFASNDQHIIIKDRRLGQLLYEFAMREGMAIARLPVGSRATQSPVEFFWLDLKKGKKELRKLRKILSRHWLELLYDVELARSDADGDFFSPDISCDLDLVDDFIEQRRFLLNATDPSYLSKKKRTILLFHQTDASALE